MPKSFNATDEITLARASTLDIHSGTGRYRVLIEEDSLERVLRTHEEAVVICDAALIAACVGHKRMIVIPASEEAKDISRIAGVILQMKEMGLTRKGMVIGVGGGVIQDIACFAASLYMRGVRWMYFPTTFLGMADSCIGGKSSINVSGYKNLVGNFYPPEAIYIDPGFIDSLTGEQILAGIFEAVKICFCHTDKRVFAQCQALVQAGYGKPELIKLISLSLAAKKWFIEVDEFDRKERQLLNFGHTFGHAMEGACDYRIPHGIAVGFGMWWALGFVKSYEGQALSPHASALSQLLETLLATVPHYRDIIRQTDFSHVLEKMKADKKHTDHAFCYILPKDEAERVFLPKNKKVIHILERSYHEI